MPGIFFFLVKNTIPCINHCVLMFVSKFCFQFKTIGGPNLKEYCTSLTKEDCRRQTGSFMACEKVSKWTFSSIEHVGYDPVFLYP